MSTTQDALESLFRQSFQPSAPDDLESLFRQDLSSLTTPKQRLEASGLPVTPDYEEVAPGKFNVTVPAPGAPNPAVAEMQHVPTLGERVRAAATDIGTSLRKSAEQIGESERITAESGADTLALVNKGLQAFKQPAEAYQRAIDAESLRPTLGQSRAKVAIDEAMRQSAKLAVGLVADPTNWPFLASGTAEVRPAIRMAADSLFAAMQTVEAHGAYKNLKWDDPSTWSDAAKSTAFALLGWHGLATEAGKVIGDKLVGDAASRNPAELAATKARIERQQAQLPAAEQTTLHLTEAQLDALTAPEKTPQVAPGPPPEPPVEVTPTPEPERTAAPPPVEEAPAIPEAPPPEEAPPEPKAKPAPRPRKPPAEEEPKTPRERLIKEGVDGELENWISAAENLQQGREAQRNAITMESNVAGKEIEEAQKARGEAIRSLGAKEGTPLEGFKETPQQLIDAARKRSGKLYQQMRQAFADEFEKQYGEEMDTYLETADEGQKRELFGETEGLNFPEAETKATLGRTAEEAATLAAAGRRTELLKEGKAFGEERLVKSELFGGRGGAQQFLESDLQGNEEGDASFDFGESGHSPALDDVVHAIDRGLRRMRDYTTIDPVPALDRAGVSQEAIAHAYSRTAVPRMIHAMLSRVFPETFRNPTEMAKVMRVMVLDNILGGYDNLRGAARFAARQGDDAGEARLTKMADEVEKLHDLPQYDAEVRAAQKDPATAAAIGRWKETVNPLMDQLYNEMKGLDPSTPRDGRGRVFGARVNLLARGHEPEWLKTLANEEEPIPQGPQPALASYRNPNVRKDRFDRIAKFTAAEYSTDPAAVLASALTGRWQEVTKRRLYDSLVAKGWAAWEKPEDGKIHGEPVRGAPVDIPRTAGGQTRYVRQTLWLPQSLHEEFRGILGTDLRLKQNPVSQVLTKLQLMQFADATSHLKNLHSVIANAQGTKSMWADVIRKMPGLSSADAFLRIAKVAHEIAADTPEIRQELSTMALQGMLREKFPAQGFQKITKLQDLIHGVDTASRVVMNRFYSNLVERGLATDTFNSRRQFVQQIGEYNKRLMGPLMRSATQSGLSPFIVAGRNFNRFSKRLLTGATGVQAPTTRGAIQMRMVNLATLTTMFALPAMLNRVLTGNIYGRGGTPLGAIDLGQPEDKTRGTHKVLDLLQLYGVRRGMRAVGLDSVANGVMAGASANDIVGKAIFDAASTVTHPWLGPGLGFAFSTLTGQRLDLRGGPTPEQATRMEGQGSQLAENLRVAMKNQNLLLYSPLRQTFKDIEESPSKDFLKDFLRAPASAVGIQDRPTPAVQMARDLAVHTPQTPVQKERAQARRQILSAYDRGDTSGALALERAARTAGHLSRSDVAIIRSEQQKPVLARTLRSANLEQLLNIWDLANSEEKKTLRPMIATRRTSQALTTEERKTLLPRAKLALQEPR